jgi:glucokinase
MASHGPILAGDVGGTNSRIAFFELREGGQLDETWTRTWPSRDHAGLAEILATACASSGISPSAATIGIAGPVRNGRCEATNLPWIVDASDLARDLGLARVGLLNDLEANAHGLAALGPEDLETLQEGAADAQGNRAIISAGTGLGEAGLFWDGRRHLPFATEGGHATFAPADALQADLWRVTTQRFGHASVERVLSGPGLVNIIDFLRDTGRGDEPATLRAQLDSGDGGAAISEAAAAGVEIAEHALDLFAAIYGAEAGNLALKVMATGGVYLGGGIAPKILPWLKRAAFLDAFLAKGRMRGLLESMPIRVVLNDRCALLGAARHAANDVAGS